MNILFYKTNKTNKVISSVLLLSFLLSGIFFMHTRKAHAYLGVLDTNVTEFGNLFYTIYSAGVEAATYASQLVSEYLQNQMAIDTKALFVKEYILDPALWVIAKGLIREYIIETIKWARMGARTGFEDVPMLGTTDGGPLFITDLKKLLWDGVYQGSGIFINSYWNSNIYAHLPEPWRQPIGEALIQDRVDSVVYDFPESSLHADIDTIPEMDEFMHLFYNPETNVGGWPAWLSLFDKPTNLPSGMYLEVSTEMQNQASAFREQLNTEALMDSGYIGEKICKNFSEPPSDFPWLGLSTYCSKWVTESPGDWVAGQVIENTTSELRSFENADEFSELLFSLMESLASRLIMSTESLLGSTTYDPWHGGPLDYDPDDYAGCDPSVDDWCECDPNDPFGDCYDKVCNPGVPGPTPEDDPPGCYDPQEPMPTPPPMPTPGAPSGPIQTETVIVDRGGAAANVTDGRLEVLPPEDSGGMP